jgi:fructose-1,6-bisphosphatase/inositol monophosphatase family enzyme
LNIALIIVIIINMYYIPKTMSFYLQARTERMRLEIYGDEERELPVSMGEDEEIFPAHFSSAEKSENPYIVALGSEVRNMTAGGAAAVVVALVAGVGVGVVAGGGGEASVVAAAAAIRAAAGGVAAAWQQQ